MQPSVVTNLETESSPGLLSALLGIYGLQYRWFTLRSKNTRGEGRGPQTHRQLLPRWAPGLHIFSWQSTLSHWAAVTCRPERSGTSLRASRGLLSRCQAKCKLICQPKCAWLGFLHVLETGGQGRGEEPHILYSIKQLQEERWAEGSGKQDRNVQHRRLLSNDVEEFLQNRYWLAWCSNPNVSAFSCFEALGPTSNEFKPRLRMTVAHFYLCWCFGDVWSMVSITFPLSTLWLFVCEDRSWVRKMWHICAFRSHLTELGKNAGEKNCAELCRCATPPGGESFCTRILLISQPTATLGPQDLTQVPWHRSSPFCGEWGWTLYSKSVQPAGWTRVVIPKQSMSISLKYSASVTLKQSITETILPFSIVTSVFSFRDYPICVNMHCGAARKNSSVVHHCEVESKWHTWSLFFCKIKTWEQCHYQTLSFSYL